MGNFILYGVCKLVEGFTREVYFLGLPCRNRPAKFARYTRCPPVACQRRWLPLPVSVMLIFRCFLVQTVNLIFYGVLQAGGGVYPRSITSRAAVSKPSGGIRSLLSLSACGLPTPIVALACICNVDIQTFSCADGEPYFLRRLQAGGGVHPRSILSRAAVSKSSGGIRSLLSLSACGLPTPVVVLACIGNVGIQVFSCADGEPYFLRRFASWWRGLPTKYNF